MWLFARDGFYSVVQKPEDKAAGLVSVRARRRDDLERLADKFAASNGTKLPEIIKTANADYPFRIVVDKAMLAAVVFDLVLEIDYSNFKNTQNDRHAVMMDIWSAARRLEVPRFAPPAVRQAIAESRGSQIRASGDWFSDDWFSDEPVRCDKWNGVFFCALDFGHAGKCMSRRALKRMLKKQSKLPMDGM